MSQQIPHQTTSGFLGGTATTSLLGLFVFLIGVVFFPLIHDIFFPDVQDTYNKRVERQVGEEVSKVSSVYEALKTLEDRWQDKTDYPFYIPITNRDDAFIQSTMRMNAMRERGDADGCAVWRRKFWVTDKLAQI